MICPVRVDHLEIRDADDNVLVYDSAREKIHVLNRTAGFVLRLCDGTRSSPEMARSLSEATGADFSIVAGDVDAIIDTFAILKLLRDE
jgi:hypothetical protein